MWVHGGSLVRGSGAEYGPALLVGRGLVVVTLNYRLGPLGFLSLASQQVPGNTGLLDQTLALSWVRSHISGWGGDPGRVTVAGQVSRCDCVTM